MRAGGAVEGLLFIAAVLLIGLGAAALAHAMHTGRFGTLARVGVVSSGLGVVLIASGLVVQSLFFGGDFPHMPMFVIPGALAAIIGLLLLGIAILGRAVVPRWSFQPLIMRA